MKTGDTRTPSSSSMEGSSFGVESLADTINSAFGSEESLSRTASNSTQDLHGSDSESSPAIMSRKRKAGNPVHPKIQAAGQRILSSEQASAVASPVSFKSSESPFGRHLRRGSAASSINLNSQPLPPLKMSPQPESGMPSTPRSGSLKSFRLSDEEGSAAEDETGSQAVQSSSGDEEKEDDAATDPSRQSAMPQLVMPSIAMPARRPFTDRGKRTGRLKVMVVGYNGVGKTRLIGSILRSCQDIVHVDQPTPNPADTNLHVYETHASTRPYASWWTDLQDRRPSSRRRSMGDGVLERNLCFVDTPGMDEESEAQGVLHYHNQSMMRAASPDKMSESELLHLLSGEGGVRVDAVLWLFDPMTVLHAKTVEDIIPPGSQRSVFDALCQNTSLIPLIGSADTLSAEEAQLAKQRLQGFTDAIGAEPYTFAKSNRLSDSEETASRETQMPLLVSSAVMDDAEEVDASILMSSQYMQPLVPTELGYLVDNLLDPENIARMRHLSAAKFLLWRQHHLGTYVDLPKQTRLHSPQFGHTLPSVPSSGSMAIEGDPSKVLVPHSQSSFYRSASPSASENSALCAEGQGVGASAYALAHHNSQQAAGGAPFRQVRLAKWAQDLQRSLNNERKRYMGMYSNPPAEWSGSPSSDSENEKALVACQGQPRPPRGRLGGDVAVIDPRDPLGILSLAQRVRRNSVVALQVAGGMGLMGAVAWWVMRNWAEVQEFFGCGSPVMVTGTAVPAPGHERGLLSWGSLFG